KPTLRAETQPQLEASGEIIIKNKEKATAPGHGAATSAQPEATPDPHRVITTPVPSSRHAGAIDVQEDKDEETKPGLGVLRGTGGDEKPTPPEPRGAILGIGVGHIGSEG